MPRVSEAHLAARRQQILDAAQTCFIRNGFHVTSMQDVIAEAGLSVGAVYRYFKSKNDIVEAIAQQYSDQVGAALDAITGDPGQSLADVIQSSIKLIHTNAEPGGTLRIAVQLWAEALRDERAAATAKAVYTRFRNNFVILARRAVATGELAPDTDPEAAGAALFSLVIGYGLQKMLTGSPSHEIYTIGLRSLLEHAHTRQ